MPLRYILGLPGTGKTLTCIQEISRVKEKDNLLYIIPEQQSLQAERIIIKELSGNAAFRVQALSFGRLAHHIFSELGSGRGVYLNDMGKRMLLRKITSDLAGKLSFYSKALDKQGFIDNLANLISEFFRYGASPEAILSASPAVSENLNMKLNDLCLIYKSLIEYMSEKYITNDEILDILAGKIKKSDFLKKADIWIDGFSGFTPQEMKIIGRLISVAENITISVTANENRIFYPDLKESDFFYTTKNTINLITRLSNDIGCKMGDSIFLDYDHRHKNSPELTLLTGNYCRHLHKTEDFNVEQRDIIIFSERNKYSEIAAIADEIIYLVRDQHYRFNEIAILTGDIEGCGRDVKNIFRKYDIPVFIDVKQDILSHPIVEMIRSSIDIIIQNWSYESVFRFIKTGYTSLTADEISMLENYVLAYGIKGYKWMMNNWRFGKDSDEIDIERINKIKTVIADDISAFTKQLTGKKYTIRQISVIIFEMLTRFNTASKLEKQISESMKAGDNELVRLHSQIWGKICGMFDKLTEILGDESVTLHDFSRILDEGFSSIDLGIIPPSADQIAMCDVMRSRIPQIKVLFVIGANEGILPKQRKDGGILSEEDRVTLASTGIELAEDIRKRNNHEEYLIYSCITAPSDKLYISYRNGDLSGKELRPSPIIAKLKKLFPNVLETETSMMSTRITLPEPMTEKLAGMIGRIKAGEQLSRDEWKIYHWFSENDSLSGSLSAIENAMNCFDEKVLTHEIVDKLYSSDLRMSVSKMEKYVECPFAYYVEHNLKAKERRIYQVASVDLGNIFHKVLEEFTKRIASQRDMPIERLKSIWLNMTTERISSFVDEIVDELSKTIGDEVLLSTYRYKNMLDKVKRISKRSIWALIEHMKRGTFKPYESEFIFNGPLTEITIQIPNGKKMLLSGRIDRIDILDFNGEKYVKIIDYKSGKTKFDINDVYFGMQIQLMLYLDVLLKNADKMFGCELHPGGVLYFNLNDPVISMNGEFFESLIDSLILKEFRMTGLVISKPEVLYGMDNDLEINNRSSIIPVSVSKDSRLYANSSAVDEDQFAEIQEAVTDRIIEIGEKISGGNIEAYPFKKGDRTGCDYCSYYAICGFGVDPNKQRYNVVRKRQ